MSFALRWEIDNVSSITNRTADSAVFNYEGFEWKASLRPRQSDVWVKWSLACQYPKGSDWRCEADVEIVIPSRHPNNTMRKNFHWKFNDGQCAQNTGECPYFWPSLINMSNGFINNNKTIVEFYFKNFQFVFMSRFKSGNAIDDVPPKNLNIEKCSSPNETGNLTVVIGDTKVKVSKESNAINFVLRWEIDNASSINGIADSAVFYEQGFEWKARMRPRQSGSDRVVFALTCHYPRGGDWKCEADLQFVVIHRDPNCSVKKDPFHWKFNDERRVQEDATGCVWSKMIDAKRGYINNDRVIVEFHFNNFQSEWGNTIKDSMPILDLEKFSSPNETGNVTIVMGDKKVKVSKELLSVHSPVFATMFYKNYAEQGKDEVEIKDVIFEEFIDLLHIVCPEPVQPTDSTVLHILALGNRFQMQHVIVLAEAHLLTSKKFSVAEKLRIADVYRLDKLRENCLNTYSTVHQIGTLQSTPDYAEYSDKMMAAICRRMMKLVK